MDFRILGPLEVADGDRTLVIGGGRQRKLLAVLLLHANEFVGSERLIDQLWGEQRPETAAKALHGYVSQLRKTLCQGVLLTRPGGYVLRVAPGELDAHRFEQLVEQARAAAPREAAGKLREALALWRGPALADFTYEEFARSDIERLEERRIAALEQRIDADLALGRHADLAGELAALVAREPLRERLRGQLMLALYRSGRQADALEAYQQTRRAFVDDLGLEPSEDLQRLQRAILEHDPALGPAPRDVWPRARSALRRPRVLAALGAVLLAGAVGVAAAAMLDRPGSAAALGAEPDSVVFIEPATGKLVAQAPVRRSIALRFGEGFLWSSNADGTLDKIDPRTHEPVKRITVGVDPGDVAVGEGAVWITDAGSQTLLRVDPRYGTIDRIALPSDGLRDAAVTAGVAVGAGSVWVAHGNSEVLRIDPATRAVRRRYAIPYASRVSFAEGAVWVDMLDARIAVSRIDAGTNVVTRPVPWSRAYGCCTAVGGGSIWVATDDDHRIWQFDPIQGDQVGSVELPGEVSDIAYGQGALWVATGRAGAVVRIDPATTRKRLFIIGHAVSSLAIAGARLAVGVWPRAVDVTAGLTGRVARLPMFNDWIESTDPAVTGGGMPYRLQLAYATCAKLFNHPDAPAPDGWRLVPEVAAGPPSVSADGLSQTFRIRSGFRFSPPLNAPVTADTFRHTIERALSPVLGFRGDGIAYLPEIEGVAGYRAGRAAHVSGLSAHGDTLTIRLTTPVPDLAERLALPQFCAVPEGTPAARDGLPQPIPSAGPYYVAAYFPGEALVVKRNPNYRGSRPHRLDAIVYEFGVKAEDSVRRVERDASEVLEDFSPILGPNGPLARRYDHASDAEPRRFFLPPQLSNVYLAFNTRRPLFAPRRVRQAVNYALDRQTIAAAFRYLPAGHYLPPGVPGHRTTPVYPARPDLRRARALIQDDGGTALLYICDCNEARAWAQVIRRNLARIGIRVRLREYEAPLSYRRRTDLRADMLLTKTQASFPPAYSDAVTMLEDVLAVPESAAGPHRSEVERWFERGTPPGWSNFPRLRAKLARIKQLGGEQRASAAGALDLELARAAPGAALVTETSSVFYSRRVGCQTYQPLYYGVDLAALCLKTN